MKLSITKAKEFFKQKYTIYGIFYFFITIKCVTLGSHIAQGNREHIGKNGDTVQTVQKS